MLQGCLLKEVEALDNLAKSAAWTVAETGRQVEERQVIIHMLLDLKP